MLKRRFVSGIGVICIVASAHCQEFGGGPFGNDQQSDCITDAQRLQITAQLERGGIASTGEALPQQYRFQPLAGTVWQDRFILNFYDNDPSRGMLDWDCSQWTYDAHYATDILIRGFAEQDVGVPVFAALDGVVASAHDGESDRNTTAEGQPANYVILHHQGTHYSWYWHLRRGSVAVAVGQELKAGTQIGQVGSSGHSWMSHLHFESRFDGYSYDTYSGPCHPGPQHWMNQTAIPRQTWISEFAMHNSNSIPTTNFYPYNPPRTGTFVRTGAAQPMGAWYVIHNEPENSVWRVRYLRPNGTTGFDSGTRALNNPYSRFSARWFSFGFAPDTNGAWTLELSINGEVLMTAPFLVLDVGSVPQNRTPLTPAAIAFDPPAPTTNDAVFCRLTVPPLQDPDYDVVSYVYDWFIAGHSYRRVTNAAFADAIPRGAALPSDSIRCIVTPYDGRQFGTPIEATISGAIRPALSIRNIADSRLVISWPASFPSYVLQSVAGDEWSNVSQKAVRVGSEMTMTNLASGPASLFRLISP